MSGHELRKLRELGLSASELQVYQPKYWSKLSCQNSRRCLRRRIVDQHFCRSKKRKSSPLHSSEVCSPLDEWPGNSTAVQQFGSDYWLGENSEHETNSYDFPLEAHTLLANDQSLQRFASTKLPGLFKERRLNMGSLNKIFASRWISQDHVVLGTKCNNIFILDVTSMRNKHRQPNGAAKLTRIPSIIGRPEPRLDPKVGGMHALDLNPSGTLMASGSKDPCDVAVYTMPDFIPVAVGDWVHSDLIFDLKWIDDEFLVTVPTISGVRSISWRGPIVTVGTGSGEILFYDVRSCKYLDCNVAGDNSLVITEGWLDRDNEVYREVFSNSPSPHAIYTHSYD